MNESIIDKDPNLILEEKLLERKEQGLLRKLALSPSNLVDFSSNDYLGLSFWGKVEAFANQVPWEDSGIASGATGSRLISGHHRQVERLEEELSEFHRGTALVFNSGYNANIGMLSCLAGRGDTYVSDSLSHASLIDGMRLSYAQRLRFNHNDLEDLERQLKKAKGRTFVITEAVFSMDGDQAPLVDILHLAEKYGASLIVDEAHSIGVFGNRGEGLCQQLGIEDRVFARVYTYGKAPACHGASIVGSKALKDYLVNFSRALIYTTALPPHAIRQIQGAYKAMENAIDERKRLHALIFSFKKSINKLSGITLLPSDSAIQSLIIPGNQAVTEAALQLQQMGVWAKPIRYPTVAAGEERIRVCLHAFNTNEEIERFSTALSDLP